MPVARKTCLGVILLILVTIVSSCSQPLNKREKGVLVGGGLGAATGAIIGAAVGAPGAGAAIGGAVGAVGGGIIGDQLQGVENRQNAQQAQIDQQQRQLQRQRVEINKLKQKAKKPAYQDE